MATKPICLQLRAGPAAKGATFTGAKRELTVDDDVIRLRLHDGSTAGGHPLAFLSELNDAKSELQGSISLLSGQLTSGLASKAPLSHVHAISDVTGLEEYIAKIATIAVPPGVIVPFAGTTVPDGWLICNGAAVSRTTYANLFAAVGTKWGSGDGSTTFNLPDADERYIQYTTNPSKVGTLLEAGLPNIIGDIIVYTSNAANHNSASGAFALSNGGGNGESSEYSGNRPKFSFDANRSSSQFGGSSKVQPPSIVQLAIIKT